MSRTKIKQFINAASASLVLAIGLVGGVASGAAHEVCPEGSHKQGNNCKVTICHRTDSVTNPYTRPDVDIDAVDTDNAEDKGAGDHFNEHKGPVATSQTVAQALKDADQKWGDIIPPVTGVEPGLNWTAEGQAVYNNGCNYVTPGGSGGEQPGTPPTTTTNNGQVLGNNTTSQVTTTPVGSAAAGEGGAMQFSPASLVGLAGSAAVLAAGAVFAVKRSIQL